VMKGQIGNVHKVGSMIQRSRLSKYKQNKLIELFVAGSTARTAASLVNVNKTTAAYYFHRLREMIHKKTTGEDVSLQETQVNASYFDHFFIKKRVYRKNDNRPIFGILKRGGKLHTLMMKVTPEGSEQKEREDQILPDSIVFFDSTEKYSFLDVSKFKQCRVNAVDCSEERMRTIDDIENFWSQAKRQLRKFNGIPRSHFHLFLKECEWRYNHNNPKEQLRLLKAWASGQAVTPESEMAKPVQVRPSVISTPRHSNVNVNVSNATTGSYLIPQPLIGI